MGQNLSLFEFIQNIYSDQGGIKLKTNKEIFIATSIWGNSARSFQTPPESENRFKT